MGGVVMFKFLPQISGFLDRNCRKIWIIYKSLRFRYENRFFNRIPPVFVWISEMVASKHIYSAVKTNTSSSFCDSECVSVCRQPIRGTLRSRKKNARELKCPSLLQHSTCFHQIRYDDFKSNNSKKQLKRSEIWIARCASAHESERWRRNIRCVIWHIAKATLTFATWRAAFLRLTQHMSNASAWTLTALSAIKQSGDDQI